jgi:hypothetical protein
MEDNLKILKIEYLINQWLDIPQILDLISGDQTKNTKCLKLIRPPMEENLKVLKLNI